VAGPCGICTRFPILPLLHSGHPKPSQRANKQADYRLGYLALSSRWALLSAYLIESVAYVADIAPGPDNLFLLGPDAL